MPPKGMNPVPTRESAQAPWLCSQRGTSAQGQGVGRAGQTGVGGLGLRCSMDSPLPESLQPHLHQHFPPNCLPQQLREWQQQGEG